MAHCVQLRENITLEVATLFLEIQERRTDEGSDGFPPIELSLDGAETSLQLGS